MEFASAAVAVRTSFQLPGRSLNAPRISWVLLTLSPRNALMAQDLASPSSGDLWGPSSPISCVVLVSPMGNSIERPVARFQDFEVNLETGEVWKAGRPLKVQDQPFKVLGRVAGTAGRDRYPGRAASADLGRRRASGILTTAINLAITKLRATLGDSADVAHLIETLPRRWLPVHSHR